MPVDREPERALEPGRLFARYRRRLAALLLAAVLSAVLAGVVGEAVYELLPSFLRNALVPLSALLAGCLALGMHQLYGERGGRRAFVLRLGVVAGAMAAGLLAFLLLYELFIFQIPVGRGGGERGEATLLIWGERLPGCPCPPEVALIDCFPEHLSLDPADVSLCWERPPYASMLLVLSYLLWMGGLGSVVGILSLRSGEAGRSAESAEPAATPASPASSPSVAPPPSPPGRVPAYSDFILEFTPIGEGGFRVRARDPRGADAAVSFSRPVEALEVENFLLRVGRPRGGKRRARGPTPETRAAKAFGGKLFQAVFRDEVLVCLRASLRRAGEDGEGLRLRLDFSEVPELAELPWEYLYDPGGDRFFAVSTETPLVRHLDLPTPLEALAVTPPLSVLVVAARPASYDDLAVEREWEHLVAASAGLVERGLIQLERLAAPTLEELQGRLRRGAYHVFHFIGHGREGTLIFEDGEGRADPVTGEVLGALLNDHRGLRLVVLNACEGARGAPEDSFLGTAQSLIRQGLPAVVAMQDEVGDETAVAFAAQFYAALADGYPVDACLTEARKFLWSHGNAEWGIPVLYLRATDGRLFATGSFTALPAAPPDRPG